MLRENDELRRGGGGDLSYLARLAFPTAPNISFQFYPCSWEELIYPLLSVDQRPSCAERQNKSSTRTSLLPTYLLYLSYDPALILSALLGIDCVDLSFVLHLTGLLLYLFSLPSSPIPFLL